MLAEQDVPPQSRFLSIRCRLSSQDIARLQRDVRRFHSSKPNLPQAAASEFSQWRSSAHELAVMLDHAYADIALPATFDLVFRLTDASICEATSLTVMHALPDGLWVQASIEHGWKHVAVLRFDRLVPKLIEELSTDCQNGDERIEICRSVDFAFVCEQLVRRGRPDATR